MTPADVLEQAADLLLIHGRCKGRFIDEREQICVREAMSRAGLNSPYGVYNTARDALNAALDPWLSQSVWNDNTDDDFEVIDTLRHVAKDLRNGVAT